MLNGIDSAARASDRKLLQVSFSSVKKRRRVIDHDVATFIVLANSQETHI